MKLILYTNRGQKQSVKLSLKIDMLTHWIDSQSATFDPVSNLKTCTRMIIRILIFDKMTANERQTKLRLEKKWEPPEKVM